MDILTAFRDFLCENGKSEITVKNYLSDIRRFTRWFEEHFQRSFDASLITPVLVAEYRTRIQKELDDKSLKRHKSSLQQFFDYLIKSNRITSNPLVELKTEPSDSHDKDSLDLKGFRFFLINQRASDLTIKNYTSDVKQFFEWLERVLDYKDNPNNENTLLSKINSQVLNTYKERLLTEQSLSPLSINRKLTSLRRYLTFISKDNLIDQEKLGLHQMNNLTADQEKNLAEDTYRDLTAGTIASPAENIPGHEREYSNIPLIRFWQRLFRHASYTIDAIVIRPLADTFIACQFLLWKASGERIFFNTFAKKTQDPTMLDSFVVNNFEKSFYAPLAISLQNHPLYQRIYHILRHVRPKWYKIYHRYSFVHYLHFSILLIVTTAMGMLIYQRLMPKSDPHVLGSDIRLGQKTMLYQGTLLDASNKPIDTLTPLRFGIYDDKVASGASLLWEHSLSVLPDHEGNFQVELGNDVPIAPEVFRSGNPLYLGISVAATSELRPRQAVPNVHLAEEAQRLGGLLPITAEGAGTENVVLALDSSGNLTIGNTASPVFQATGGSFTLRAQALVLSTLPGSGGNITLSPDSFGIIDLHKPLQNTTEYGSLLETRGAVEVADAFAVIATTSGESIFSLNQFGSGPLISASSSGITKFSVDNTGNGYFANSLTVDGTDLATNQFALNVFNRKAGIINLGGEAVAITIGSASGTTTIRNASTDLYGNLTVGGKVGTIYSGEGAGLQFSGSGTHGIKANSGTLLIGSELQFAKDVNLMPQTADGRNDLGSSERPFDTLYVNNIVTSAFNSTPSFWAIQDGLLRPVNISNDIAIGGNATGSASWQVFGAGPNAGTASSSGDLTFSGITTNINQLNGGAMQFQTSPGGTNQLTPRMVLSSNGNVGIGTTEPLFRLDLVDSQPSKAVTQLTNADTGSSADVLSLKVGSLTPGSTNSFITFLKGNGDTVGRVDGTGAFVSGGEDFAEYFKKHDPQEDFAFGHLVCLHSQGGVTKCTAENPSIIGVITDRPAFIGNATHERDSSYVLVGIQGQVPVLTSQENGEIQPTDRLTYSQAPGIAVKAIGPSQIVGQALDTQDPQTSKVMTYVKASWYDPRPLNLSQDGNLQISLQKLPVTIDESSQSYSLLSAITNGIKKSFAAFSDVVIGNLAVGLVNAQEFLAQRAKIAELLVTERFTSPVGTIENLSVRIISPLSGYDGLSLVFAKDRIDLVAGNSLQPVASFDKEGNASFSGDLAAQNASLSGSLIVGNDASIAGTLRVNRLIASEIEGLPQASSSATYVTNITNVYQTSTNSASPTPMQPTLSPTPKTLLASEEPDSDTINSSSLASSSLVTDFAQSASFSGMLADATLTADFATILKGFMAFGPASFADISVGGQLAVGGKMIFTDGSINVLGQDLNLQPLRQGNVSFMSGLVTIDTAGNLMVNGNALFANDVSVKGRLKANLIAPVPDADLVVQLGGNSEGPTENNSEGSAVPGKVQRNSAFVIQNASGSAKFSVNDLGEVVASGSASFLKLMTNKLTLVKGAQADTSVTQTVASSSAGTATINTGFRERTIVSPFVTEDSLIYLTPTSDTQGVTPYIARQTAEDPQENSKGSFTIQITRPITSEINLNWWIIN